MLFRSLFIAIIGIVFFVSACKKEDTSTPYNPTPYQLLVPYGFPPMIIPDRNPTTVEGVALGHLLYYDPILDKDESRSCSSCHHQVNSFTSGPFVLPHVNLGWNTSFLWNGKIQGELEDIMLFEVEDFLETDLDKLNNHSTYPGLFKSAFNADNITSELISQALAQFIRTLISGNSKYDKALRNELFLEDDEERGYEIFFTEKGDCFHCHGGILLTNNLFHNTGLDSTNIEEGLGGITHNPLDFGKFKTPTLRNIEFTAPYMHDGRLQTIEDVIDFYSEGLKYNPTIDPLMKNVHQGGIQLTNQEKDDLKAFLLTFSDSDFITNPEFSQP